ncbi:MAG: hypothetical protein JOZ96_16070 [Acidobacteria bacterium]|nr:hypothetical protein [Acidobacteriota bacterium]
MKALILSATLLLSFGAGRQDETPRSIDPKLVPAEGSAAKDFVPKGWKLETDAGVVKGDLNGDGAPDAVLRLVEDVPVEGADGTYNTRYRALVILLAKPGGGYARAAVAPKLLGCSLCYGVLGDPEGGNIQVEIKGGVLDVGQLSGSREATDLTLRFRRDAATGRFQLIGQERSDYDRAAGGGTGTSTNYLTGVRVTKTTTVRRGRETTTSIRTRVPRTRLFIEDVDYEKLF